MKKYVNGELVDMSAEEVASRQVGPNTNVRYDYLSAGIA